MPPSPRNDRVRRIAVFADTHDGYPPQLPGLFAEADELWHLGDVCAPQTLIEFTALGRPLFVVRGNNDWNTAWPLTLRLERAGRVFHLEHIAPRRAPAGADFILCGHTHVPGDEHDDTGVRWLNPGCISYPRGQGQSFAWLTISAAGEVHWRVVKI
ncbi:phosphodiesterase [Verrucomicrobia bacterium IMCC26134]|jgi:putative phosphoesterase|nr:phosphodiesterase [Verrucomicrobia bacterium IMCC26134]